MPNHVSSRSLMDLVPGGCHTYSKGPDQFPANAPQAIVKGQGARVLGDDGRWYVDWGMGLTAVSLGHGHPEVCQAVSAAIADGTNFIRPAVLEAVAAERFLDVFGGDMVKFCKNGSVATTAAVKLARGYTGRGMIALPFEHPFFSYDDWFIGTTEADYGIPDEQKALSLRFRYNDLASLEALFAEHGPNLAGVILEPVKFDPPVPGFLEGIRALCDRHGTVLILDETITGLKWTMRGGQGYFDVAPDLSVWGKGLANGFSACALSGRREIMSIGGSNSTGRKLFLVSTTHGAESGGLAAMLKTIDIFLRTDVIGDNWRQGARLKEGLQASVLAHGLDAHLAVKGYPCLLLLTFVGLPEARALEWKTLLMQEMARHGVLSQGVLCLTPSHDAGIVDETVGAFDRALARIAEAWQTGSTAGFLEGQAIKPVFRKFQECVKSRCGRTYPDEAKEPCCLSTLTN
jgi:glutamate-1-semialdehyde 2,1-aminomutase